MPTSSSSALIQISNLPYTVTGASHYSIGAAYNAATANNHTFVQTNPGQASINVYQGVGSSVTYASLSGNYLLFTVVYRSS